MMPDMGGESAVSPAIKGALEGIEQAVPGYEAAREYDAINLWEQFVDSREGRTLRQADVEYEPNFCGVVINAVSNRMTINSITAQDDKNTTAVNEVWDANQMALYWPTWQRNALRDGDGYLMVWPKPETTPPAADLPGAIDPALPFTLTPDQVNITYVDPVKGRLFYDHEDPRVKDHFAQLWSEPAEGKNMVTWRLNLIYPYWIERYGTKPVQASRGPRPEMFLRLDPIWGLEDNWPVSEPGEDPALFGGPVWPEANPYGEVPVFHLRTELQYGKPEHADAFALQDAMSKLIEMLMVTVNFQGWPQMYALQEAENLGNQSIREDPLAENYADLDEFDDNLSRTRLPNGPGQISNETGTDLEMSPGAMAIFKNFKTVGQFTTADPNVFLEPWREFGKAISSTTDTPLWKFSGLGGQLPSGESLKVATAPLNKKVERRCTLFGPGCLREALQFALRLCGIDGAVITIEWEPAETVTEQERWTLVKMRMDAGVPYKEAMMMAGVPEKQATEWDNQRQAAAALASSTALELARINAGPSGSAGGNPPPVK